jgi:hypothetical protein
MASDYGNNFGFRRSDESVIVREGRFKTPTTPALQMGTAVQIDAASDGYLKACAANAALVPGFAGLLTQEEAHVRSLFDAAVIDSYFLGVAKVNALSVINTGGGVKVWLKNTAEKTEPDGQVHAAVTMVDLSTGTPAVGDELGWDGSKWLKTNGSTVTNGWMTITAISGTTYCEAVLLS